MRLKRRTPDNDDGAIATQYVHALTRHEKALAALYDAFERAVPQDAAFWRKLADEERSHADLLGQLKQMFDDGTIVPGHPRFNINEVGKSEEFLGTNLEDVWAHGVSRQRALDLAVNIERGLVESDYFKIFEEDDDRMRFEFNRLRRFSAQHLKRVVKKRAAVRKGHTK